MPPAFSANQGFGQHPPAVVELNPLERHNLRRRMESLLQQRLTGRSRQQCLGLQGQRRKEHLAQQRQQLATTGQFQILQIRTGLDQLFSRLPVGEVDRDLRLQKRQTQHEPLQSRSWPTAEGQ